MATVSGYSGPRRSWTQRVVAAARLDATAYEEVEADTTATGQAAAVVVIAAICTAIGTSDNGILGSIIGSLIAWPIWSGLTYLIGDKVFHGTATWGELLRTLGFAQAPAFLNIFGLIPFLGAFVMFITGLWVLFAGVIALRQALDITTGKAVLVALMGVIVLVMLPLVLGGAAWLSFAR